MPQKKGAKWKYKNPERHAATRKYFGLDRYAIQYFRWAHARVRRGKCPYGIDFPLSRDGYIAFCEELGPIPPNIIRPSVGRRDHSKGYIRGNIRWEEYNYNSRKRYANQDRFKKLEEEIPF